MSEFTDDILTGISYFYEAYVKAVCYFFGHKWGPWMDNCEPSPIGCFRECQRCSEYDHDSQMLKSSLRKAKGAICKGN